MSTTTTTTSKSSKFSKEEEILLQDFSRNVSTKSSALFYGNAAIVSAIPVWLFWRIHQMEPVDFSIYYLIAIAVSTYLMTFAYTNVKFIMKHKIAQKRDQAVALDVTAKLADNKKLSKKDKDDRILWTKNEVADYEATTFSIFYNNCLFVLVLLVASFFVFKNFQPVFNYILSMGAAAGLTAFFSTSTK